jgi:hypothetical protein
MSEVPALQTQTSPIDETGAGFSTAMRRHSAPQLLEGRLVGARRQHVGVTVGHHALRDLHHLRHRLAGAEDGFAVPAPQLAMVIHVSEAEILVRQAAEPLDDRLYVHAAVTNALEERAQLVGLHRITRRRPSTR